MTLPMVDEPFGPMDDAGPLAGVRPRERISPQEHVFCNNYANSVVLSVF